jgi:hypothetical protein
MVGSGKEPEVDAKALRIIGRWSPQWLLDAMAARIMDGFGHT